jgi:hypothetical protein
MCSVADANKAACASTMARANRRIISLATYLYVGELGELGG